MIILSSGRRGGERNTSIIRPGQKRRWKVMLIGAINEAPTFVAMVMRLYMKWYTLSKQRGL